MFSISEVNDPRLKINLCMYNDILKAGRYVLDKHTRGIDTRILSSDLDALEADLVCLFGENPKREDYKKIYSYIQNKCNLLNVYDLKPNYRASIGKGSRYINKSLFQLNDDNLDLFKDLPIVTYEIGLEGPCNNMLKTAYVHEMYHALLYRHKGSIENILNREFLSIFMELVASYDIDSSGTLLDLNLIYRFINNKWDILNKERNEFSSEKDIESIISRRTYILSTLEALALFSTYNSGSKRLKEEIDRSINQVLMGDGVIEDVINKYEATPEKGFIKAKKHIRRLFN